MSDKLVFENEVCAFYENEATRSINNYCVAPTAHNNPPLNNCCAFLAVHKEFDDKVYVLFQDRLPIYEHTKLEAIGAHIDMLRLKLKFEEKDDEK